MLQIMYKTSSSTDSLREDTSLEQRALSVEDLTSLPVVLLSQPSSVCLHRHLLSTSFRHGYRLSSVRRHCQFGNGRC